MTSSDPIVTPTAPANPPNRHRTVLSLVVAGGLVTGGAFAIAAARSADASGTGPIATVAATSSPTPSKCGPGDGSDGRITAVNSSGLTVRDLFGQSRHYAITSKTTVHEGPQTKVAVSALSTGEHVHVSGTKSGTAYTATDIDVHPATIDGSVTSIASGSISVADRDGFTRVVVTDSATSYTSAGKAVSRSTITSGSVIHAEGTVDANGTSLDADSVARLTASSPAGPGPKPAGRPGAGRPGAGPRAAGCGDPRPAPPAPPRGGPPHGSGSSKAPRPAPSSTSS